MNRSDLYYSPAHVQYRRERIATSIRRSKRRRSRKGVAGDGTSSEIERSRLLG